MKEEKIKQMLKEQLEHDEKPALPGMDDDTDLYLLLFSVLNDEPQSLRGINLADEVIKQIKIQEEKQDSLQYSLIISSVIISGLIFAYLSLNYINPVVLKSTLYFIDNYKWICVFVIICITAIEVVDKYLVRRKLFADI